MRHLRHMVLAAVAVALCVAPVAGAESPREDRGAAVVAPAKDKWLGESWAQLFSIPLAENPFAGNGDDPCLTLANKVIQEFGGPCTIEEGTTFTTGFGSVWSSADDPSADTRAEQLAVAVAIDREIVRGVTVTVDDGSTVDIHTPRFELFSPQRTVLLPPDAIFDLHGPQIVTLTAHAWGAAVHKLSLGQHTIVVDTTFSDGFVYSAPHIVNVVPKHSH